MVTGATALSIGGDAATISLGDATSVTTINDDLVISGGVLDALSALARVDSLQVGGGYGSTGVTISNGGNIQANGTLTIDGISTLTGDVTTAGNIAVNGGSITTTAATGNIFNTNAATINFAGAANNINIGLNTGNTNVQSFLNVSRLATFNQG